MAIGDVISFEDRAAFLLRGHYGEGAPSETAAREEEEMVNGWACERCGLPGVLYRPFTRIGERRWLAEREYLPHAVCGQQDCGYWWEF
jgi:hypothetical protein